MFLSLEGFNWSHKRITVLVTSVVPAPNANGFIINKK